LERKSSVPPSRPEKQKQNKIWRRGMWKAGLVGVVALILGSSAVLADSGDAEFNRGRVFKSEAVMSVAQVARLKAALKLTAAQEPLWAPIEQAFREISHAQAADGSHSFIQGIKNRAASAIGLNTVALRRLASAAYPLIRSLNEEQKQNGLAFARSAGLASVAAAF
jgi:hypothetical protein